MARAAGGRHAREDFTAFELSERSEDLLDLCEPKAQQLEHDKLSTMLEALRGLAAEGGCAADVPLTRAANLHVQLRAGSSAPGHLLQLALAWDALPAGVRVAAADSVTVHVLVPPRERGRDPLKGLLRLLGKMPGWRVELYGEDARDGEQNKLPALLGEFANRLPQGARVLGVRDLHLMPGAFLEACIAKDVEFLNSFAGGGGNKRLLETGGGPEPVLVPADGLGLVDFLVERGAAVGGAGGEALSFPGSRFVKSFHEELEDVDETGVGWCVVLFWCPSWLGFRDWR